MNSIVDGEFRIPSDNALAHDDRTSCKWQSFIEDQDGMRSEFAAAWAKLSLLGQPPDLVDCSEVIPGWCFLCLLLSRVCADD